MPETSTGAVVPTRTMLRLFAVSWTLLLLLLAFGVRHYVPESPVWYLCLAAALPFAWALSAPALALRLYRGVEAIFRPVGEAFSLVILAAAYYVVFTAIALMLRIAGRDLLRIRARRREESGWLECQARRDHPGYFYQY